MGGLGNRTDSVADIATRHLASGDILAIERHGQIIGFYIRVRPAPEERIRPAPDRLGKVTRVLAETGMGGGHLLAVEGRLEIRSYTDSQAIRRKGAQIVANAVRFLTPKSAAGTLDGQQVTAIDQIEGSGPEAETATAGADAGADVDF